MKNVVSDRLDRLERLLGDMGDRMAEDRANLRETDRLLQEVVEIQKETSANIGRLERTVAETSVKVDATNARVDETIARVDETIARVDETIARVDILNERMGGVRNSIGDIVQMVIIPGVRLNMNALGHNFTASSPGKTFFHEPGGRKPFTEVDLLLENCEAVMAVEVKTKFAIKWVEKHLERLKALRENESVTGIRGKALYAAVAGVRFDDDARDLAEESGMYIIEIEEEMDKIKIATPEVPAIW